MQQGWVECDSSWQGVELRRKRTVHAAVPATPCSCPWLPVTHRRPQVLAALPVQRLKRSTLFVDVLSVKEFPKVRCKWVVSRGWAAAAPAALH